MFSVENKLKIFKEFLRINYLQYYLHLLISENINILEIFEQERLYQITTFKCISDRRELKYICIKSGFELKQVI